MVYLDNDQFLSRLTLMFDKARTKKHVQIVMKRYDGKCKPTPKAKVSTKGAKKSKGGQAAAAAAAAAAAKPRSDSHSEHQELMCLIRATYRHEKISSIVHAKDVNKFQQAYCNLLRVNIDGLKRQKKQKLKKSAE